MASIQDYHLWFDKRKDAVCYKQMLLASDMKITSDIIRLEQTNDGYHITE